MPQVAVGMTASGPDHWDGGFSDEVLDRIEINGWSDAASDGDRLAEEAARALEEQRAEAQEDQTRANVRANVQRESAPELSIKELKAFLSERNIDFSGCIEKSDLLALLAEWHETHQNAPVNMVIDLCTPDDDDDDVVFVKTIAGSNLTNGPMTKMKKKTSPPVRLGKGSWQIPKKPRRR